MFGSTKPTSMFHKLRFCSFFFFTCFGVTRLLFMYCLLNSNCKCWFFYGKQCISVLFMDPQIPLFSNFFIKNGSHDTIHIFKNYFTTVFSVFSFQFQQNKFYPNRPLSLVSHVIYHLWGKIVDFFFQSVSPSRSMSSYTC